MKIELHFLQNFAPSNLNRDDTGAPKDCEFGGFRRARISSQCLKRAIRQAFVAHELFGSQTVELLAARTKRLVDHVAAELVDNHKRDEATAKRLVSFVLQAANLKVKEEDKTEYLLFIPRRLIKNLVGLVQEQWANLEAAAPAGDGDSTDSPKKQKKSKSDEKSSAKNVVPKHIAKKVAELFADTAKTPDLALFGRMIADNAEWNVDAACQVAHAISTNRVTMEFDFFTAVDDLKSKDNAGSEMMGTVAFQSGCFYRYACVDVDALSANLGGSNPTENETLTKETLTAFLKAAAFAVPTGKQNSMAAQNLPSYLLAVVRKESAPQSFANAFAKPIRPSNEASLVEASVTALEQYASRALRLWGVDGVQLFSCGDVGGTPPNEPSGIKWKPVDDGFGAWVDCVVEAAGVHG